MSMFVRAWRGCGCLARAQRLYATLSGARERAVTLVSRRAESLVPALDAALDAWRGAEPLVWLFAANKELPRDVLVDVVQRLHGESAPSGERLGFLSDALPTSVAPQTPGGDGALHSVALAALPPSRAVAFRSTIPGVPRVAVGRWPSQKELWRRGADPRSDRLDTHGDWRGMWGRENIDNCVPEPLAQLSDVDAVLCASDDRPEGLLEGLDHRFPGANVVGITSALTPFVTGRERTLFYGDASIARIHEDGAVGIALLAPRTAPSVVDRTFDGLAPVGPRLEITGYVCYEYTYDSARGNILTSLGDHNAAQQFLRIVLEQSTKNPRGMSAAQVRDWSSQVAKDDVFYLGVYTEADTAAVPLLVAQVNAGHPMRGTLSIATESELSGQRLWAQVLRPDVPRGIAPVARGGSVRFVFLTPMAESGVEADAAVARAPHAHGDVLSLPDVFLAASEKGWFARSAGTSGAVSSRTHTCAVPHTRVALTRT